MIFLGKDGSNPMKRAETDHLENDKGNPQDHCRKTPRSLQSHQFGSFVSAGPGCFCRRLQNIALEFRVCCEPAYSAHGSSENHVLTFSWGDFAVES